MIIGQLPVHQTIHIYHQILLCLKSYITKIKLLLYAKLDITNNVNFAKCISHNLITYLSTKTYKLAKAFALL